MSNLQIKSKQSIQIAKSIISESSMMMQLETSLTITDTLDKPIMRSIFKGDTGKIGFSVVQTIVNRFILSFGFSTPPTPVVIEMITLDTLEYFAYETLQDVILFFKMARTGKFGSTKKGVDSNLVFGEWFPQYLEFKSEARENNYIKKKGELNSNNITIEDVKHTYSKIEGRKRHSKIITYIDQLTKSFNRAMLEECIKMWEKDEEKKNYIQYLKSKRRIIKE